MGQYFFFCSCWLIALAYCFGKMAPVIAIMGLIYLLFSAMDNALIHVSGHYPADKIEERIPFALSNTHLYLAESDDERDDNYATANIFDISCSCGGYISSLSAITVSV